MPTSFTKLEVDLAIRSLLRAAIKGLLGVVEEELLEAAG